ncbi:MAG: phage tail protein [Comamonadaceae bacterium]|nr:MAG: phage tail protein [Comamonadaceae bacterium]
MLKPSSLRDQLTAAVPWFAANPENLTLFINAGRIITTGTGTLSFEYAYTLQIVALGYAGHADALVVPMLEWISRNQPELLDNPDKREKALRFNVEFLTDITTDIGFEIDLTERVLVRPRAGAPAGAVELHHVAEPPHPVHIDKPEHWTLWMHGELLAQWDHDPR